MMHQTIKSVVLYVLLLAYIGHVLSGHDPIVVVIFLASFYQKQQ